MFIYNFKVNGSKLFKYFFITVIILIICILGIVIFRIFSGANNSRSSCLPQNKVSEISAKNYTNILKAVHEDIDSYIGLKINFTGYVYRVSDLNSNQFVLARDMLISSNSQCVVVGFLCEYENTKDYIDEDWINITGEITKGDYHGDMPIIKITEIKKVDKPSEEYVFPPDESYIPTSGIL